MLPLNSTPCPQIECSADGAPRIEDHPIGSSPVECADCLKYVNACMTILRPYSGQSAEFNQMVVFQNANYLIKDLTLEEHYLYVRRAEALAAAVGLLYQQRLSKQQIPDPKQAQSSAEFTEIIRKQRDATRPKKERKLLDDREKGILALTKLGLARGAAEKMVDAQMSKEGRSANPIN